MNISEYLELKAEMKHLKLVLFHNGLKSEFEELDKLDYEIFCNLDKLEIEIINLKLNRFRKLTKDIDPWVIKGDLQRPLFYD